MDIKDIKNGLMLLLGFPKTVYFNFKYLKLKDAFKFPVFISNKVYLKGLSGKIVIKSKVKTGMIRIGFGETPIFDKAKSRSIWNNKGIIIFDGKTRIGHGSKITCLGELFFGDNFTMTAESTIYCFKKISFGKDCLISWENLFMDSDIHKVVDSNGNITNNNKDIIIGNKVWIGCRCTILKGSIIPNNSVIAANSGIYSKYEGENQIFAGNPAKAVKQNIRWTN